MGTARIRIGDLTLDTRACTLSGPGGARHLEPRIVELAAALADRPDEVVTRDELIESVWRGYPGADASLTSSVSRLRRAMAECGGDRDRLQTVPKRGYRLVGPVTPLAPGPARVRPRRAIGVAIVVVGLVSAVAAFLAFRPDTTRPAMPRIAVLPFDTLGPESQRYIAAGLTEEITTQLARISGLSVISRTSAVLHAPGSGSIPEIADALGADYLLEGSVRWQAGGAGQTGRVRIAAQLIHAGDDSHVWAEIYDRPLQDVFAVQAEIARAVTEQLGARLGPQRGPARRRPTGNLEAYTAYLRGLELAGQAYPTPDDVARAYAALRRAVSLDPEFAEAWAELSIVLGRREWDMAGLAAPAMSAREALERAVALAPDLDITRVAEGMFFTGAYSPGQGVPDQVERAIGAFRRALALQPSSVRALTGLGRALRMRGDFDTAVHLLEAAVERSPREPRVLTAASDTHAAMRHWSRAEALRDRLIELEPASWAHWLKKARYRLAATGSVAQARAVLAQAPDGLLPPRVRAEFELYAGQWQALIERARVELKGNSPERLGLDRPAFAAIASYAARRGGQTGLADKLAEGFRASM